MESKKKVAIVTTHRANNFGAVLQAYSLACACNELGAEAKILDWRTPAFEYLYNRPLFTFRHLLQMLLNPRSASRFVRSLRHLLSQKSLRKQFGVFRETMPLTSAVNEWEKLHIAVEDYDVCIVGSDQIWNPPITAIDWRPEKFDRAYLLTFAEGKRKCAYGASIGKSCIEPLSLVGEFVAAWGSFSVISMREKEGADYVAQQTGFKVPQVLDPVLLHSADFWQKIAVDVHPHSRYIVVYNLISSDWLLDQAIEYSVENHCKVVNITIPAIASSWIKGISVNVGPGGFVDLIANADAVFSSSFHACAFSALFKRRIFVCLRQSGGFPNSRFSSFEKWTSVIGDDVKNFEDLELREFDFSKIDGDLLRNEREKSCELLRMMING